MPHLEQPTERVRHSYLAGERSMAADEGETGDFIDKAESNFAAFVERRRQVRVLWQVPVTELWYVDDDEYIGTVMVRHHLTPELRQEGGHIGYHVVPRHRRRGHATRMLAEAAAFCRDLGLTELLVTCDEDNIGSRKVIEANRGGLIDVIRGLARYRVPT